MCRSSKRQRCLSTTTRYSCREARAGLSAFLAHVVGARGGTVVTLVEVPEFGSFAGRFYRRARTSDIFGHR